MDYEVIDTSQYKNGDILVFEKTEKSPDGHIQVYKDGKWYSDFKQKNLNPFGVEIKFVVFRRPAKVSAEPAVSLIQT